MTTAGMGNPTPVIGIKRVLSTTPVDANPEDYLSRPMDAVEEALTSAPYDTGWIAPTMQNGWVSNGVFYRRVGGIVYFRGFATGGATGIALTLPVGFRPIGYSAFAAARTADGSHTFVVVNNASLGTVVLQAGTGPHLDCIRFPVG